MGSTKTRAKTAAKSGDQADSPRKRARVILNRLKSHFPDAHCELDHENAFQLLVATVLSAQSTDVAVNKLTPTLFARFSDAKSLAKADVGEVEDLLKSIGMYRQKSKRIVDIAQTIVAKYKGEVPHTMADLVALNGVGRKTANVLLGAWFKAPEGVVVDTHVQRIAQRLGLTKHTTPEEIEQDLMAQIDRSEWDITGHLLVFLGRRICAAKKPDCEHCPLADGPCPSAFAATNVGRKKPQARS
jgi:endonuclease-3